MRHGVITATRAHREGEVVGESAIDDIGVDSAEELFARVTPLERVQHLLHAHPSLSPAMVLVLACVVFAFQSNRFLRPQNLSLIFQQVAVVGSLAIGQTMIILTAGIDLSVGASMILTQMIVAKLVADSGVPGPLALVIGFGVGMVAGGLNGILVTRLKLPPFIVTLGTLNVFTAVALLLTHGQTVEGRHLSSLLLWTGHSVKVGNFHITTGVLLMLGLYLVVGFVLRSTAWGRHVYAAGDDAEAAELAGIQVKRVVLSVYVAAGLVIAFAAWILIGRIGSASPNAASEANLDSITAVVIGGTSLFGGRGVLAGSLLGALIVGVFRNGLALAGVDVLYQTLAVGILIIAAVGIDQWIRKVRK
jgi:fructose transport system permease protein